MTPRTSTNKLLFYGVVVRCAPRCLFAEVTNTWPFLEYSVEARDKKSAAGRGSRNPPYGLLPRASSRGENRMAAEIEKGTVAERVLDALARLAFL